MFRLDVTLLNSHVVFCLTILCLFKVDFHPMTCLFSHMYVWDVRTEEVGVPVFSCSCQLVTLMDLVKGRIDITPNFICFYSLQEERHTSLYDFSIAVEDLRTIYFRRFNLRRTALEIFLIDRSSFFLNFDTKEVGVYMC